MQYMLLIYGDEAAWESATAEEKATEYERHRMFAQAVTDLGGKIVGGEELDSTSTATTLRGDLVTDGPFIDTKEVLGGFYIIEVDDLDQMIAIARHCPSTTGGIEIRPIVDHSAG